MDDITITMSEKDYTMLSDIIIDKFANNPDAVDEDGFNIYLGLLCRLKEIEQDV